MKSSNTMNSYRFALDTIAQFKAYSPVADSDALAAFGMNRHFASDYIKRRISVAGVKEILVPIVEVALMTEPFIIYLQEKGIKERSGTVDAVLKAYVEYDVLEGSINFGVPHEGMLRILALLDGKKLNIWEQPDVQFETYQMPMGCISDNESELPKNDVVVEKNILRSHVTTLGKLELQRDFGGRVFTAFGLDRARAALFLKTHIDSVQKYLVDAVQTVLVTDDFIEFLDSKKIKVSPADHREMINAYIEYDVLHGCFEYAYPHVGALKALAHLRGKRLRFWETKDTSEKKGEMSDVKPSELSNRSSDELKKYDILVIDDEGDVQFQAATDRGMFAYASFGLHRSAAATLFKKNIEEIRLLIIPAVEAAISTPEFIEYLKSQGLADKVPTCDEVIHAYIDYDVLQGKIEKGVPHEAILKSIALLQNKALRLWEAKGEKDQFSIRYQFSPDNVCESECIEFFVSSTQMINKIDRINSDEKKEFEPLKITNRTDPLLAFELMKENAVSLIWSQMDKVVDRIRPAANAALENVDFQDYLRELGISVEETDGKIERAYVFFNICKNKSMPHPSVLTSIAYLQNKGICYWERSEEDGSYTPHPNYSTYEIHSDNIIHVCVVKVEHIGMYSELTHFPLPSKKDGGFGVLGISMEEAYAILRQHIDDHLDENFFERAVRKNFPEKEFEKYLRSIPTPDSFLKKIDSISSASDNILDVWSKERFFVESFIKYEFKHKIMGLKWSAPEVFNALVVLLIKMAVRKNLLKPQFLEYLRWKGIAKPLFEIIDSSHQIAANIWDDWSREKVIIEAFLEYEFKYKKIGLGWSDPEILNAIAALQGIKIQWWENVAIDGAVERKDMLFLPFELKHVLNLISISDENKKFERLEELPKEEHLLNETLFSLSEKKTNENIPAIHSSKLRSHYENTPAIDFATIAEKMHKAKNKVMDKFYNKLAINMAEKGGWNALRYLIESSPEGRRMEVFLSQKLISIDERIQAVNDRRTFIKAQIAILKANKLENSAELALKLFAEQARWKVKFVKKYQYQLKNSGDYSTDFSKLPALIERYQKNLDHVIAWPLDLDAIASQGVEQSIEYLRTLLDPVRMEQEDAELQKRRADLVELIQLRSSVLGKDADGSMKTDYSHPIDEFLNKYRPEIERKMRWDDLVLVSENTISYSLEEAQKISDAHEKKAVVIRAKDTVRVFGHQGNGVWGFVSLDPAVFSSLRFPQNEASFLILEPTVVNINIFHEIVINRGHVFEGDLGLKTYERIRREYGLPEGDFMFEYLRLYRPAVSRDVVDEYGQNILAIASINKNAPLVRALLVMDVNPVDITDEVSERLLDFVNHDLKDAGLSKLLNQRMALNNFNFGSYLDNAQNSSESISFDEGFDKWLVEECKLMKEFAKNLLENGQDTNSYAAYVEDNWLEKKYEIKMNDKWKEFYAWTPFDAAETFSEKMEFLLSRFKQMVASDTKFIVVFKTLLAVLHKAQKGTNEYESTLFRLNYIAHARAEVVRYASSSRDYSGSYMYLFAKKVQEKKEAVPLLYRLFYRPQALHELERHVEQISAAAKHYCTLRQIYTNSLITNNHGETVKYISDELPGLGCPNPHYMHLTSKFDAVAYKYKADASFGNKPDVIGVQKHAEERALLLKTWNDLHQKQREDERKKQENKDREREEKERRWEEDRQKRKEAEEKCAEKDEVIQEKDEALVIVQQALKAEQEARKAEQEARKALEERLKRFEALFAQQGSLSTPPEPVGTTLQFQGYQQGSHASSSSNANASKPESSMLNNKN